MLFRSDRLEWKDNRVKGIKRDLKNYCKNMFYNEFLKKYKDAFHLENTPRNEAPCKPLVSQEQEQEQEQEHEKEEQPTSPTGADSLPPAGEKLETTAPSCPHVKIIESYNEALPSLARVDLKLWKGSQREKDLRTRWKEDGERQDLDWWKSFFLSVGQSDFLTGRKKEWKADLGWLLKRSNFIKVLEGKYDNVCSAVTQPRHDCGDCTYNHGQKCPNLLKEGFDAQACNSFIDFYKKGK